VAGDLYGGSARTDWAAASTALHPASQHGGERPASSRGYLYQLAAVTGWTAVPFLPWLRQPVLILAGNDDPIIPVANARLMHRLIPDSRLHVYPGGHLGLITEAAALAPVVDGFLAAR
jgi:pimeloyl-ACP methyl ester carboxylesterase